MVEYVLQSLGLYSVALNGPRSRGLKGSKGSNTQVTRSLQRCGGTGSVWLGIASSTLKKGETLKRNGRARLMRKEKKVNDRIGSDEYKLAIIRQGRRSCWIERLNVEGTEWSSDNQPKLMISRSFYSEPQDRVSGCEHRARESKPKTSLFRTWLADSVSVPVTCFRFRKAQ